jgi:hypothetical protein
LAVSFQNQKPVQNCNTDVAMLTIPKSSIRDIRDLHNRCGFEGMKEVLAEMMRNGYDSYYPYATGSVMHCLHKASTVSVHFLHLHSFCKGGSIDGMPNNHSAYCVEMKSTSESYRLADQLGRMVPTEGGLDDHNAGCHKLTTEDACVGGMDGRSDTAFQGSPCKWCCGDRCTTNGNKCEPVDWLITQKTFVGHGKTGLGDDNCPAQSPGGNAKDQEELDRLRARLAELVKEKAKLEQQVSDIEAEQAKIHVQIDNLDSSWSLKPEAIGIAGRTLAKPAAESCSHPAAAALGAFAILLMAALHL